MKPSGLAQLGDIEAGLGGALLIICDDSLLIHLHDLA